MVRVQYCNVENESYNKVCTLATKQDCPTDSLTLSRSKISEATTAVYTMPSVKEVCHMIQEVQTRNALICNAITWNAISRRNVNWQGEVSGERAGVLGVTGLLHKRLVCKHTVDHKFLGMNGFLFYLFNILILVL